MEPPLLRVTGEGTVRAEPDVAEVSLGFTTRAQLAEEAYQQTAAAMTRVVQALTALTISQEQMQSEQISLTPLYDQERLVGYEASAALRVRLNDLDTIAAVIDQAIAAGANSVRGIRFDLEDPRPFDTAALSLAVQDAQRKAASLARSLGIVIGPVRRVEAEPAPGPIFPVSARAVAFEAMPVLPGTLDVTRRVVVDYIIR